jgi:hypothetical protein
VGGPHTALLLPTPSSAPYPLPPSLPRRLWQAVDAALLHPASSGGASPAARQAAQAVVEELEELALELALGSGCLSGAEAALVLQLSERYSGAAAAAGPAAAAAGPGQGGAAAGPEQGGAAAGPGQGGAAAVEPPAGSAAPASPAAPDNGPGNSSSSSAEPQGAAGSSAGRSTPAAAAAAAAAAGPRRGGRPPKCCAACGTTRCTRFKLCGRCRAAVYCSKECQAAAWPQHWRQCVPLPAQGEAAGAAMGD